MFNQNFNPADVMLQGKSRSGAPSRGIPFLPVESPVNRPQPRPQPQNPQNSQTTLGPETVRATGSGPFDSAFRQNLATYAGGNLEKPGGFLGFNPTGSMFGNPTGGGTAPVAGMPTDLLSQALGSGGYATPQAKPKPQPKQAGRMRFWLDDYMDKGRMMRTY